MGTPIYLAEGAKEFEARAQKVVDEYNAFETLPGASFTVNGASPPKNSALTTLGAEVRVTANWSVIGQFEGDFGSGFQSYAGTGTIKYAW